MSMKNNWPPPKNLQAKKFIDSLVQIKDFNMERNVQIDKNKSNTH